MSPLLYSGLLRRCLYDAVRGGRSPLNVMSLHLKGPVTRRCAPSPSTRTRTGILRERSIDVLVRIKSLTWTTPRKVVRDRRMTTSCETREALIRFPAGYFTLHQPHHWRSDLPLDSTGISRDWDDSPFSQVIKHGPRGSSGICHNSTWLKTGAGASAHSTSSIPRSPPTVRRIPRRCFQISKARISLRTRERKLPRGKLLKVFDDPAKTPLLRPSSAESIKTRTPSCFLNSLTVSRLPSNLRANTSTSARVPSRSSPKEFPEILTKQSSNDHSGVAGTAGSRSMDLVLSEPARGCRPCPSRTVTVTWSSSSSSSFDRARSRDENAATADGRELTARRLVLARRDVARRDAARPSVGPAARGDLFRPRARRAYSRTERNGTARLSSAQRGAARPAERKERRRGRSCEGCTQQLFEHP